MCDTDIANDDSSASFIGGKQADDQLHQLWDTNGACDATTVLFNAFELTIGQRRHMWNTFKACEDVSNTFGGGKLTEEHLQRIAANRAKAMALKPARQARTDNDLAEEHH